MSTSEVDPLGVIETGRTKVGIFVGTLASAGAISLASDIGHAGFMNIGFYIPGSIGDWNPQSTQNKLEDPRLSSSVTFEALGVARWSIPDIKWIHDPQASTTGTPSVALTEGNTCTLVVRYGLAVATDWATTQIAWSWPVSVGKRSVVTTQQGEGGKYCYSAPVAVLGSAVEAVAITA